MGGIIVGAGLWGKIASFCSVGILWLLDLKWLINSETETQTGALQQQTEWESLHPAGIFITESISENSELKFTTAKCGIANLELLARDWSLKVKHWHSETGDGLTSSILWLSGISCSEYYNISAPSMRLGTLKVTQTWGKLFFISGHFLWKTHLLQRDTI